MSDRQDAVEALRKMADLVESNPQSTLAGSLEVKRWNPVSRREIDSWVKSGYMWADPMDQDRTQTTTLTFDLKEEAAT